MKNNSKGLIAAILVAAVLISGSLVFLGLRSGMSPDDIKTAVVAGLNQFVKDGPTVEEEVPVVIEEDMTDDDPVQGNEDAPVTIVEFSEYQCPYCGRYFADAYPEIKAKYVDTGKVKYVFRDYPLPGHQYAHLAALAAECVSEQKGDSVYFQMHDELFGDQSVLSGDDVKGSLEKIAAGLGVDVSQYNECVETDKFKDEIEHDIADGKSVGVGGTPSFLINGQLLVGALPFSEFEKIIEAELAK